MTPIKNERITGDLTVVEVATELTVKVGGSFILLNADGVFILGPTINIGPSDSEVMGSDVVASSQQPTLVTAAGSGVPTVKNV